MAGRRGVRVTATRTGTKRYLATTTTRLLYLALLAFPYLYSYLTSFESSE